MWLISKNFFCGFEKYVHSPIEKYIVYCTILFHYVIQMFHIIADSFIKNWECCIKTSHYHSGYFCFFLWFLSIFLLYLFLISTAIFSRYCVLLTDLNFVNIQWYSLSHVIKSFMSKDLHCDTMILVRTIWNCQFCTSNCNFAFQSNSIGSFVFIMYYVWLSMSLLNRLKLDFKKNVVW